METPDKSDVNRNVKDTVFRSLFAENRENALSLYNAVNRTNYTNTEDLIFTTLSDAVYMGMKNDNAFLFQGMLNLYEHQSTLNPNMPIRGFVYAGKIYEFLLEDNKRIYGKSLVKIPTPKYVVFYNGLESKAQDDIIKLKLSDAFEIPDNSGEYEWTATMININVGHNIELMQSCKVLSDYSQFIATIRKYGNFYAIPDAVDKAIDECISKNILSDFLKKMRVEVKSMFLTEFDQKGYEEYIKSESYEEGMKTGRQEGELDALKGSIVLFAKTNGLNADDVESVISGINNKDILQSLLLLAPRAKSIEAFKNEVAGLIKI